ncbi:hypothetical protein T440DRAFT_465435 [Plenodomus tracheiphilus IPT5]|uniref:Uncharacterized protein n=1 Tax=Plenodomus tracheiphilus IPT5 TaxID=1408161 RepID=A0A6A7BE40_9PLEO|nr:hypothetical protein T440DRAFT_465435 [Plenodomus tracheiphilus IPT5]
MLLTVLLQVQSAHLQVVQLQLGFMMKFGGGGGGCLVKVLGSTWRSGRYSSSLCVCVCVCVCDDLLQEGRRPVFLYPLHRATCAV